MLIRNQNGKMLIPAGRFVFAVTRDNKIIAGRNLYIRLSRAENSIIGEYSTEEKAIKVLDMIQEAYTRVKEYEVIGKALLQPEFVFQIPQDDEVKV